MIVMSPGREEVDSPILLTKTANTDYEQLCALDVLGLADSNENDQQTVYCTRNLRSNYAEMTQDGMKPNYLGKGTTSLCPPMKLAASDA
jgi:hypothetical protein